MRKNVLVLFCLLLLSLSVFSQDKRAQYPFGLRNAQFGVNVGYINYPFTLDQVQPGFTVESVGVPHPAVRIVLYGGSINKYLSARVTYMRPVNWVEYRNINNQRLTKTVWMNIAGLTLNGQFPLTKKISVSAEAGLGVITRNGFEVDNKPVITNANYGTGLFGGAIQYHLNKKWDLQISSAWSPENKKVKQPATFFLGAGFNYFLRPLSAERVSLVQKAAKNFPKQTLILGFTSNALGYGVNNAVSKGPVPIFWGGDAKVKMGISASYQRNIFHTKKVFAFDWAAGFGIWRTRGNENFVTISLNPVLRFTAIRKRSADFFLEYAVAGPSFISKVKLDDVELGRKFTFHDFMGIGMIAGPARKVYAGIRIAHYSNGNIFPQNDGVMIPLTFNFGYCF